MSTASPFRLALIASMLAFGCGPSLRLVAASNDYFEYCYAADRDASRTDVERRACWAAWQEHYETGQPPDRIDYAHERLVMLDPDRRNAIELATGESAEEAASDPAASPEPVVPVATETITPEGAELSSLLGARSPPTARERRSPVIPRSRSSACADVCAPGFRACALACTLSDRGCVDACRHRFRQCTHSCF